MKHQAQLQVVKETHPDDSLFVPTDGMAAAFFKGNEDEDMLCGACGFVLGDGISRRTMLMRTAVPHRLVFRCPKCSANNVVRATKVQPV
jgi:hypothetical protein